MNRLSRKVAVEAAGLTPRLWILMFGKSYISRILRVTECVIPVMYQVCVPYSMKALLYLIVSVICVHTESIKSGRVDWVLNI